MKFPAVRWPRVFLFLPILLSLVGSLHRGEAGRVTNTLPQNSLFHKRLLAINRILVAGDRTAAIPMLESAYREARAAQDDKYQRIFLSNLGACQFAISDYSRALISFLAARDLSEKAADYSTLVALNTNISSLYLQMNNLPEARTAAERGLSALAHTAHLEQKPKLLIQIGRVLAKMGLVDEAEGRFREGIAAASDAGDWTTAAFGWDSLGDLYRVQKRLGDADIALTEGFRLRKALHLNEIESSYRNLARLRSDQGDLHSAGVLLDQAVAGLKTSRSLISSWSVFYERGRVRLRQGRIDAALDDLRTALRLARNWRLSVIPTDGSRVSSESGLELIYAGLIEAGTSLFLETRRETLVRETFDAAEGNRAASLRLLLSQPSDAAEAPSRTEELVQGNAMERAQRVLDADSVLLSFHLGERDSWLWAVTRDQFALYRLAGRDEIATNIAQFERAVRTGSADALFLGETLHRMLFGSLEQVFRERQRWLVSLDKDLFHVPFAALVAERRNGEPVYLAEEHEIQIASGAMLLQSRRQSWNFAGPFVGIGDPIYNTADPRWKGGYPRQSASVQLARLPGTRQELEECARVWNRRDSRAVLLTGPDATIDRLRQHLSDRPAVIHIATHVLEREKSGWVALSLNRSGVLEQLGPGEIAPGSVKVKLVVLSGCGSGKAEAPAVTGLMGLTRAWLGGGAEAILATHWATPDDSGPFLVSFYTHLRDRPADGPAAALRQARLEMLRSGTYRARPEYWAAYFLVGNS